MVVRKGNRPHVVPLAVPEDVQFAARFIQMEAAERAEKARMKKLVLEMHEAQKAADELEYAPPSTRLPSQSIEICAAERTVASPERD
ncbi:unnamed protein product [Dibothriocephalus latus]|uniref:Up-frameshift suppressor 2 C-terminal domain-containing protein n=1 Tax=Dibothriocephalus latus TaxID=60516 RepID=A0A3P7N376_DIBLA|nr:unnamed protein product [Dibothriocephalus latus]